MWFERWGYFTHFYRVESRKVFTKYPTMGMLDQYKCISGGAMTSDRYRGRRWHLHTSPWIVIGSVGILLVAVVVLAFQNYSREKIYMSRILSEKGAAIIKAMEAGARTGMMGMGWGGRQVQTLIQETALLPDVLYIRITDRDGRVVASSDREEIGKELAGDRLTGDAAPTGKINWRVTDIGHGRWSFEVYRDFRPIRDGRVGAGMGQMMRRHGMMMGPDNDWQPQGADSGKDQIIRVGLDPAPFEEGRKEDIRNTVLISGILIVLGMAGFISMFWMQSYRSAQRSLQDTSAVKDQVVSSLPVGLIATDKDGRIAFYNRAAERITGLDLAAAQGKAADQILPHHFCGLKDALDRGETISEKEMECAFAGDRVVPVSISASQIINADGVFVGQVLIIRDLGEVRRLQDEIHRKEKLAAIGGLAAGVAHEIRNPLSSIKGIASYYKDKFAHGSEDYEMAGVMIEEVDRLSRVISELLEFARPTQLSWRTANINDLLAHSTRLVQQEAAAQNVRIALHPAPEDLKAEVDPDRLTQCFLNLYLNALQAMDDGGQLTIAGTRQGEDAVAIVIKDSGTGIAADDLTAIFDPYFTTKAQGTGLGLAIVHKVIEAHQGQIKVRSIPGEGTAFTVILPLEHAK
jgi:two-component system sensor histidine kinase HydH